MTAAEAPATRPSHGLLGRARGALDVVYREVIKFGVVGAVAFVVDLGLANLLWHTVLADKVTTAKVISGAAATLVAWIGNRQWTFRHRRSRPSHHEVVLFFAVNGVALGISAVTLFVSHYGLGLTSRLADNASTVVGIGLGTLFRFWAYRRFVFAREQPVGQPVDQAVEQPVDQPGQNARSAATASPPSAARS